MEGGEVSISMQSMEYYYMGTRPGCCTPDKKDNLTLFTYAASDESLTLNGRTIKQIRRYLAEHYALCCSSSVLDG